MQWVQSIIIKQQLQLPLQFIKHKQQQEIPQRKQKYISLKALKTMLKIDLGFSFFIIIFFNGLVKQNEKKFKKCLLKLKNKFKNLISQKLITQKEKKKKNT